MSFDQEIYDRSIILESLGGDEQLLREVCQGFLDCYAADMHVLGEALATQDLKRINRLAAEVKKRVGNFAASAAVESAHALEKATRGGWHEAIPDLVLRVDAELEKLFFALRGEFER